MFDWLFGWTGKPEYTWTFCRRQIAAASFKGFDISNLTWHRMDIFYA